jgi:hypothetical protein
MKTYNQFVTEAYAHSGTINEFNVGGFVKDRIAGARQGIQNFKKNPIRSIRGAGMGLLKYGVKDDIAASGINVLRRATGNNPRVRGALDAAEFVAPMVPWRKAAAFAAKPAAIAGAAILATPTSTSRYDQVTGPNAYYNRPGYKKPTQGK